jgi:hypothetical protein
MSRRLVITAFSFGLLFTVGCGSTSGDDIPEAAASSASAISADASASAAPSEAEAPAEAEASADAEAEAKAAAEQARAEAEWSECKREFDPLLNALQEIDSRLNVGLGLDQYNNYLGDAQVTYDDLNPRTLDASCVRRVGVPLDNGFNEYLKASTKWEKCIQDYGCEVKGAPLVELREHWSDATRRIKSADARLQDSQAFSGE